MRLESQNSRHEVCLPVVTKKRRQRKPDDPAKKSARNLRHRIKTQQKKTPHAVLFVECRECGASIKPSYKRGFCANDGKCRDAFFKKVQVRGFVRIKHQVSDLPTLSLLPVKTPARVVGAPRWDSSKRRLEIPANGMLSVLFPQDEPLFATFTPKTPSRIEVLPASQREVCSEVLVSRLERPEQKESSVLLPERPWSMHPKRVAEAKPKTEINPLSREEASVRRPLLFPPCVGVS
jgi:hypothetical protein